MGKCYEQSATATHVAQHQPAQDATASKPRIEAWEQALQRIELNLLQLHIAASLQKPCQSALQPVFLSWCSLLSVLIALFLQQGIWLAVDKGFLGIVMCSQHTEEHQQL